MKQDGTKYDQIWGIPVKINNDIPIGRLTVGVEKPVRERRLGNPLVCYDGNDGLDEFFADNANVHIERMSETHWWIGIDVDGTHYRVAFTTKRAPIHLLIEEDKMGGDVWESNP